MGINNLAVSKKCELQLWNKNILLDIQNLALSKQKFGKIPQLLMVQLSLSRNSAQVYIKKAGKERQKEEKLFMRKHSKTIVIFHSLFHITCAPTITLERFLGGKKEGGIQAPDKDFSLQVTNPQLGDSWPSLSLLSKLFSLAEGHVSLMFCLVLCFSLTFYFSW